MGWVYVVLIVVYSVGGVFPLILTVYHGYLTHLQDGMTTNESCKGSKKHKPYLKLKKGPPIWDPRGETQLRPEVNEKIAIESKISSLSVQSIRLAHLARDSMEQSKKLRKSRYPAWFKKFLVGRPRQKITHHSGGVSDGPSYSGRPNSEINQPVFTEMPLAEHIQTGQRCSVEVHDTPRSHLLMPPQEQNLQSPQIGGMSHRQNNII